MAMVSRIDAYQQRHRWAGLPLAVLYKFADDQGSYLGLRQIIEDASGRAVRR
jgi:hypothetical protein